MFEYHRTFLFCSFSLSDRPIGKKQLLLQDWPPSSMVAGHKKEEWNLAS
jgi:hypothetical protein